MNYSPESRFDADLDGWIIAAVRSAVADFWQLNQSQGEMRRRIG